ncbi:MAG: TrgA family protein [Pseudomonadota bacterium]
MPQTDRMPTASKAFAAAFMGVLGWYAAELYRPLMPEGTDFGWFNEATVATAVVCGWVVIGSRMGRGMSDGISAGLTGVFAFVCWSLFLQSGNEMLRLSLENRFGGPFEAIQAMFEIALDFGINLAHVPLLVLLVGGGILIGIFCELVARRWA